MTIYSNQDGDQLSNLEETCSHGHVISTILNLKPKEKQSSLIAKTIRLCYLNLAQITIHLRENSDMLEVCLIDQERLFL